MLGISAHSLPHSQICCAVVDTERNSRCRMVARHTLSVVCEFTGSRRFMQAFGEMHFFLKKSVSLLPLILLLRLIALDEE
jgi:hypothetical protein